MYKIIILWNWKYTYCNGSTYCTYLNIEKTKCIIFSYKNDITKPADLNLFIDGMPVEQVTNVKLLGVKLDHMLSWSEHRDYIVSTMGKV